MKIEMVDESGRVWSVERPPGGSPTLTVPDGVVAAPRLPLEAGDGVVIGVGNSEAIHGRDDGGIVWRTYRMRDIETLVRLILKVSADSVRIDTGFGEIRVAPFLGADGDDWGSRTRCRHGSLDHAWGVLDGGGGAPDRSARPGKLVATCDQVVSAANKTRRYVLRSDGRRCVDATVSDAISGAVMWEAINEATEDMPDDIALGIMTEVVGCPERIADEFLTWAVERWGEER